MSEPQIICPNCHTEIRLTEGIIAPLVEESRKKIEQSFSEREIKLQNLQKSIDTEVQNKLDHKLSLELSRISKEQFEKAKFEVSNELNIKNQELANLQETLKKQDAKLLSAQQAEVELLKKQRALDEAKREIDLTIERRIQQGLNDARASAKREIEENLKLKVLEKDQTIQSMQKKIEELKQKAEQGSQQLQGEVQELELESLLAAKFPYDSIQPVAKGEFGGDILQIVFTNSAQNIGSILWESKRTKAWSDSWLAKLRDDQRAAKADISVLVSNTLPQGIDSFGLIDGVWVCSPRVAFPLAAILRNTLIEVSVARNLSQGLQTKTEMIYQYLTGPRFKLRIEAIVEAFSNMQEDLNKEKKAISKQWAKRDEEITRVMTATVGMYGDLQGIAGKSLQEIEGLEISKLNPPEPEN